LQELELLSHGEIVSARLEDVIRESNLEPSVCVLRRVTRTSRSVVAAVDAALKPAGLTGHQFNLLMTLARSGPMNVNGVAAAVGMHPSTVPRLIAPLARKRLVRSRAGKDRRERVMAATESGNRKLLAAYPYWAAVQRRVETHLGDQGWRAAIEVLREIRKSVDNRAG
jgi:DNA-binding MarR family transcriptional regulator